MITFLLRRLAAGVVLIVAIAIATFCMLYASGGDIARRILGPSASAEAVAQRTHELGLDRPLLLQFGDWAGSALRGDFGTSWFTSEPVANTIMSRLGVTLTLVVVATVLTAVVSVALGTLAARRGGLADSIVQVLAVVGFAVPNFLVAIGLVSAFALTLHWFAPTGYVPFTDDPVGWLRTATLPIIALALGSIAGVTQQVRGSMLDALGRDYVRTLRSRGLSENSVVFKHVLRNAAGPALAVLAVQFVSLFGGAVIVEQMLAIPGLGQTSVTATSQGDMPTVMGLVLATAAIVVVVNLVVDALQGVLNPKVRLS
jgi:peptide/nickel transport system permease protein